jgi:prephenate dehydrogenase
MPEYRRVTIVGVGLIGGSIGLAIRKFLPEIRVTGFDNGAILEESLRCGAIDTAAGTLEEACAAAELIVLARAVDGILSDLDRLGSTLRSEAVVTDVGSTKVEICRHAWSIPKRRWIFHGGHPMAGSEQRGVRHANADLFRDRPFFLCPEPETAARGFDRLIGFLERLGARVECVDPGRHDEIVSAVSHLPQMVALALAAQLDELDRSDEFDRFAGPALGDMLRIGASDVDLWKGIIATNREPIRRRLQELIRHIDRLGRDLDDGEPVKWFDTGNRLARKIRPSRRTTGEGQ